VSSAACAPQMHAAIVIEANAHSFDRESSRL